MGYLRIGEAAKRLGVSPPTVRRWADLGLLPCFRVKGFERRIDEEELERFIAEHTTLAKEEER